MVIGVFTSLSGVGGIQQFSRHAGAVLQEVAQTRGHSSALFSLNDAPGVHSFSVGAASYSFRGFGRRKAGLFAALARLAPKLELAYLGHSNLAPLGMPLRLLHPRLRYWVVAHGVEVWEPLSLLRRWGLRRAHLITAVSADTAERMAKAQGLDPRRIVLLPPALEPGFAALSSSQAPRGVPAGSRVVLSVGRMIASEPGKGFDTVIRAMPQILRSVPECFYVVVGDGDDRNRLERLAEEHQVAKRVLFAGEQTAEELKRHYSRCDVFAMPSRQEGFGIAYLEAMAFGKPVVGGKQGGTSECVRDGRTGFLIEYDCPDVLAERLIQLLQDEHLRSTMGELGRRSVEENFSFEQFRRKLSRLLPGDHPVDDEHRVEDATAGSRQVAKP